MTILDKALKACYTKPHSGADKRKEEALMPHTLTLTLPEHVYHRLRSRAKAEKKRVTQVIEELISAAFESQDGAPEPLRAEMKALEMLSDEELWKVAESTLPPAKQREWNRLLTKRDAGTLTDREQQKLEALVWEGDHLTLLKSTAYALLKRRGHPLPSLEKLRERQRKKQG
jgi:hypothetical protein